LTHRGQKTQLIITKIVMGDYVKDLYLCAKFGPDRIRGFCTLYVRSAHESDSATFKIFLGFWQFSTVQTPAPILTLYTSNDVVSHKDVPIRGPGNKYLSFDPIFA